MNFSEWIKPDTVTLLLYPFDVNRWDIVTLLQGFWNGSRPVTLDGNGLTYNDVKEINNSPKLIFDDVSAFNGKCTSYRFSKGSKVVILSTWGDTFEEMQVLTHFFPKILVVSLDLPERIRFILRSHEVIMSPKQATFFEQIQKEEDPGFPYTRRLGLYLYPEDIRDSHGQISDWGWISHDYLNTLDEDGIKLATLIDEVIIHEGEQQVIFTYDDIELIQTFLRLRGVADVIVISGVPHATISGVKHIHLPDDYNFAKFRNLLRKIERDPDLVVHTYMARLPGGTSTDEILLNQFYAQVHKSDSCSPIQRAVDAKLTLTERNGLTITELTG